ncbi:uncharacterized protein N7479_006842 [Penicillium vulpinum]|uniref:uncharacterized protein n=1 Tax=Penicillium vulpinum TaxID=29845 RepID=UPI0025466B8D|nr:uncharacterized protein N7479_006842 [Penicillium vulpinum]KAJ5959692.1 hypothetical protein N7479_006842 [Penicillium vulpinum]
MAPKRSNNRFTDYSLGLLNNINALGRDAADIRDPKRRRATHADIFEIPISHSPIRSPKIPQTEPKNTNRLSLRSRRVLRAVQPDSSPSVSDNEEDKSPSNGESGSGDSESESIQSGPSGSGEKEVDEGVDEEVDDNLTELQREAEHDPFPEPVDLFPAEDEDQADDQDGYEARGAQGNESGDKSEYGDKEQGGDQAAEEARDAQDNNTSEDGSEYEDEEEADDYSPAEFQNHTTPTQQIANANTPAMQILESIPRNKTDDTHINRMSANAQESKNVSSQLQGVPETPSIQSPRPNHDHRSARSNIFTWLTEATKESGFKDTWEAIRKTRKTLKTHADPSTKEHFRGIIKLIERLRDLFETMTNDPASASSLKNKCSLIANGVFKETQWIIYTEAPEDEENGAYLVNQLEAHIVPRLIDLIILGFKIYKTIHDRGSRHFRIILDLLWGSCDRISSLAQMHYDISRNVMAYSKRVLPHVKALKDALKDGRLRETPNSIPRRSLPYKHFELEEVDSHISCGRWTHGEKIALRDGLQLYEGDDRYIDIKCDNTIGGQLSERILQDIQGQAINIGLDDPRTNQRVRERNDGEMSGNIGIL